MGFFDKISGVFFKEVDEYPEDVNDFGDAEAEQPLAMPNERSLWREQEPTRSKKSNIMAIPGRERTMQMILVKATSYDDMQVIARHIKEQKVVVVNFEDIDKAVAQRMVDFLSGAVFSLDGAPKKVSGATFIFSSSSVALSGQIMDGDIANSEFAENAFPWSKRGK